MKLKNSAAMDVFIAEMIQLHRGQGMDICWRDGATCPTLEEYEEMVVMKTGGLFRLSLGLMQVSSHTHMSHMQAVLCYCPFWPLG